MIPVVADSASVQARNGDNQLALHPMAKPAQLVTRVLLDCPRSGDLLLDCFLGSGTPLLNLTGHDGSALLTANFSEIEAGKEDGDERQFEQEAKGHLPENHRRTLAFEKASRAIRTAGQKVRSRYRSRTKIAIDRQLRSRRHGRRQTQTHAEGRIPLPAIVFTASIGSQCESLVRSGWKPNRTVV